MGQQLYEASARRSLEATQRFALAGRDKARYRYFAALSLGDGFGDGRLVLGDGFLKR